MPKHSKKSPRPKVSAAQRDRLIRELVKEAKRKGYLNTNLKRDHVTKYAARKARELDRAGLLISGLHGPRIEPAFIAAKAKTKAQVKAARKAGMNVVRDKIVIPNRPEIVKRINRQLARGRVAGVTPVGNNGPGTIERVILPWNIADMSTLIRAMDDGEVDNLKGPDEYFAFKFYGNRSNHKPFRDARELRDYLLKYKSIFDAAEDLRSDNLAEEFEAFELFRLYEYPWDFGHRIGGRGSRSKEQERVYRKNLRARRVKQDVKVEKEKRKMQSIAEKNAKRLAKETPKRKADRLAKQAAYQDRYRKDPTRTTGLLSNMPAKGRRKDV